MDEWVHEALEEFCAHWNRVEGRLKEVEQLRHEVIIPSINELRYSGRKMIDAWALYSKPQRTPDDEKQIREALSVARQYLYNAEHDTTDAACFHIHEYISDLLKEHPYLDIVEFYPPFADLHHRILSANEAIAESRRDREERIPIYKELGEKYVPELIKGYQALIISEKMALAEQKKRRFKGHVRDALGIAGVLIGIISLVFAVAD